MTPTPPLPIFRRLPAIFIDAASPILMFCFFAADATPLAIDYAAIARLPRHIMLLFLRYDAALITP